MTEEEWTAVRLSLLVAVTATAASLPLAASMAKLAMLLCSLVTTNRNLPSGLSWSSEQVISVCGV